MQDALLPRYAVPHGAFYLYADLSAHGVTDSLALCDALRDLDAPQLVTAAEELVRAARDSAGSGAETCCGRAPGMRSGLRPPLHAAAASSSI